MKTVFIINPCAGQGKRIKSLMDNIQAMKASDVEMYITKAPGDATVYVKSFCENFGSRQRN